MRNFQCNMSPLFVSAGGKAGGEGSQGWNRGWPLAFTPKAGYLLRENREDCYRQTADPEFVHKWEVRQYFAVVDARRLRGRECRGRDCWSVLKCGGKQICAPTPTTTLRRLLGIPGSLIQFLASRDVCSHSNSLMCSSRIRHRQRLVRIDAGVELDPARGRTGQRTNDRHQGSGRWGRGGSTRGTHR